MSDEGQLIRTDPVAMGVWKRLTSLFATWRMLLAGFTRRSLSQMANDQLTPLTRAVHWKVGLGLLGGLVSAGCPARGSLRMTNIGLGRTQYQRLDLRPCRSEYLRQGTGLNDDSDDLDIAHVVIVIFVVVVIVFVIVVASRGAFAGCNEKKGSAEQQQRPQHAQSHPR